MRRCCHKLAIAYAALTSACGLVAAGAMQWQLIDQGSPLKGRANHLLRMSAQGETIVRIEDQYMVPQMWVLGTGEVWKRRLEAMYPPSRYKASFAYDSDRGVLVRFGGFDKNQLSTAETWEYDGQVWTQRTDVGVPPARGRAAMTYDPDRGVVVLFGGLDINDVELNDLWEYDGVAWQQANPPLPHPPERFDASLAYDAARGRLVMAFGRTLTVPDSSDTWEYDGNQWIVPPPGTPSIPRREASMAYDEVRGRVYVFGGETSVGDTIFWTGVGWQTVTTSLSPAARVAATMIFDEARGELLLFGGFSGDDRADLWSFDGSQWTDLTHSDVPESRRYLGLAFDEPAGVAVTYGGYDGGGYYDNTREWDGGSWNNAATASNPGLLDQGALAFDRNSLRTTLFGGFDTSLNDSVDRTWEYDATQDQWTELFPSVAPPARGDHAIVFSETHGGVILFGGFEATTMDDTWLFADGNWQEFTTAQTPTARFSFGMAYDESRSRVIIYGGGAVGPDLSDTWELDAANWTEVAVSGPGARVGPMMAYDSLRQKTVLAGGAGRPDDSELTWEYDGAAWTSVSTTYSPDMRRQYGAMVWDSAREVAMLAGGAPNTVSDPYNDVWVYGWDADDDLVVGKYDNCTDVSNPDQANADGDPAGDVCDCASGDPGAFAAPQVVTGLAVDGDVVSWDDQASMAGSDTEYDLVSGSLVDLRSSGDFGLATCLAPDLVTATYTDVREPAAGDGFYYLARATNVCGIGTYGRTGLDGASPCP